eukprot:SAG11_NODE_434_length_9506_cov_5.089295_9_plen_255_part_00
METSTPPQKPDQLKQWVGERLYPLIEHTQPELAGEITGMILNSRLHSELLQLLDAPKQGEAVVAEMLAKLEAQGGGAGRQEVAGSGDEGMTAAASAPMDSSKVDVKVSARQPERGAERGEESGAAPTPVTPKTPGASTGMLYPYKYRERDKLKVMHSHCGRCALRDTLDQNLVAVHAIYRVRRRGSGVVLAPALWEAVGSRPSYLRVHSSRYYAGASMAEHGGSACNAMHAHAYAPPRRRAGRGLQSAAIAKPR